MGAGLGETGDDQTEQARQADSLIDQYARKNFNEQTKEIFKTGGDIVATYTEVKDTVTFIRDLGTTLGIFDAGVSVEDLVQREFAIVNQKLDTLLTSLSGVEWSNILRDTTVLVANGAGASNTVRNYVRINGVLMPDTAAVAALDSSFAAAEATGSPSFFRRIYTAAGNNGDSTTTSGVTMAGEWKYAISPSAPPVDSTNSQFEWRIGLPAYMDAIAFRLNVIEGVYPTKITTIFQSELDGYRARLAQIMKQIDDQIGCGLSLWMLDRAQHFTVKAMCADRYTGTWASVEKTGAQGLYSSAPSATNLILPPCDGAHVPIPPPGTSCAEFGFPTGVTDLSKSDAFVHTGAMTSGSLPLPTFSVHSVKNDFFAAAPKNATFADLLKNGLDDARMSLRRKIGLFEIQRMIDRLYALGHGTRRPDGSAQIRNGLGNCLSSTPGNGDVGARIESNTCADPTDLGILFQAFRYDPEKDTLSNYWGHCVDVQAENTRRGTPVQLYTCLGNDAQRWSFDPEHFYFRNALGRVLDTVNSDATPGALVWTWDENGVPGQHWGYPPPVGVISAQCTLPQCTEMVTSIKTFAQ